MGLLLGAYVAARDTSGPRDPEQIRDLEAEILRGACQAG